MLQRIKLPLLVYLGLIHIGILSLMLQTCKGQCTPDVVENAVINPNQTTFNADEWVEYVCNEGYNHTTGDRNRTCQANDQWTGVAPLCTVIVCTAPPLPVGSTVDTNGTDHDNGTRLTYACDIGHNHTAGNLTRMCQEDGTWSELAPVCTMIVCTAPPLPVGSTVDTNGTDHDNGTRLTYACDIGHNHTAGNLTRMCQEDGTWSELAPVCTMIVCTAPPLPVGSTVDTNGTDHDNGTRLTYACDIGHNHTAGNLTRMCQEDGTWSELAPVCTMIVCTAPPLPVGSTVDTNGTDHDNGTRLTYACDIGHNHTAGNLTRMCQEDGTWSELAPVCTMIVCTAPPLPVGSTVDTNGTDHDNGTRLTYACDIGHNHTAGNLTRMCQEDGTWSELAPVCTMIVCTASPLPFGSTVDTNGTDHDNGTRLTYACNIGHNHTAGNLTRMCQGDGTWSELAPVCTIITCVPEDVQNATITTSLPAYNYESVVTYECDVGFNHSNGDLSRTCTNDGSWNGTALVCEIISCVPEDVQNATITTSLPAYNYESVVTYECDEGFNHSSGDLSRTCTNDGSWNGTALVCEIVQCQPPSDVVQALYSPLKAIYNWPDQVEFRCNSNYHHVSGANKTSCNANGTFPDISLDCTVLHNLTIDTTNSPLVVWINSTVTSGSFFFKFDGICDFGLTSDPVDKLDISRVITGNDLEVSVSRNAETVDGMYNVTVEPNHGDSTWASESFEVYYGNQITDLQAYVNVSLGTIVATLDYIYTVSTNSNPSIVTLDVTFEEGVAFGNDSVILPGVFTSHEFTYAFTQAGEFNISFTAINPVTPVKNAYVVVNVKAPINNVELLLADSEPLPTGVIKSVYLEFNAATILPLEEIAVTFNFDNGIQKQVNDSLYRNTTLPYNVTSDVYYDMQGVYNITAAVSNSVSDTVLHKVITVWDNITVVTLEFVNITGYVITGQAFAIEFRNVPRSGFEYVIDYTDGDTEVSSGSNISFTNYTHQVFTKSYSNPGVYHVILTAYNGGYNTTDQLQVTVEDAIKGLTARLDNPIPIIEVDTVYTYEAQATEGSNVTVQWEMGDNTTISNILTGEFTYDTVNHTYTIPGYYNILVTANNLVSTETFNFSLNAFYKLNNFEFTSSKTTSNITHAIDFFIDVKNTAQLPMGEVNYTIDYNHTSSFDTDTIGMWSNFSLPVRFTHEFTFTTQGEYNVTVKIENIFNRLDFNILIGIWDGLLHLDFEYVNDNGVYTTNQTAQFEFTAPPQAGFKYRIDYDDGTKVEYMDDDIYYRPYNLTIFEHIYTSPGVYILTWTAFNQEFTKNESKLILVQNPVPSSGFSLQPDNKKYPWKNLQSMVVPFNITLLETVALPTNTTCIFYPTDGSSDIPGLTFTGPFFDYNHEFKIEGNFTPSFNCSNLETFYVYEYNVTVQKFLATYITVEYAETVPLNKSDTVEVFFNIENQGFALIPYGVTLDFDFGDGTTSRRRKRAALTYDKPTYTHTYTERGNYTVTVKVVATVTNTQQTLTYSLRIGTMYFEYSDTIAYINDTLVRYTMHGVLGSSTIYTLDFDDNTPDGTCNSPDYNGCFVDHYCPFYGYKLIQVVASNVTFVEIDWINVTCDNPITVGLDVPWTVSVPDGGVDLILYLNESALYLPVLNIQIHMGDPINRDTYNFTDEITYDNPFKFPFDYIALGRHTITVLCWNLINETSFQTKITVTNENFFFTGSFDRKYSQYGSPIYLSSMRDTEIFSRLLINADRTQKFHVNYWIIQGDVDVQQDLNRHGLIFSIGLLEEKKYLIKLNTSFVEEPFNIIQEPTYIEFVIPPPHVEIVGGTRRIDKSGSTTCDAFTLSYDLAHPNIKNLTFSWSCVRYTVGDFDSAESKYQALDSGESCVYTYTGNGTISLDTSQTQTTQYYVVTVDAENSRGIHSTFTQIIRISGAPKELSIRCKINCLAKVSVTSFLQLVPAINNNCPAYFTWRIYRKTGTVVHTSTDILPDLIANNLTKNTDQSSRTLMLKGNAFDYGSTYLVSLTMVANGLTYGPAYHELKTNQKPKGGNCNIIPYTDKLQELPALTNAEIYESRALIDIFNLTCQDWTDEGFTESTFTNKEPLFYYFFARYKDDLFERQILYFDPGSTSNLVTFQIGDPGNDYQLEVVLRIVDVFGDYEEMIYTLKSVPDPRITSGALNALSDQAQVDVVKPYLEEFTDELIKANRSWDYRTLSRRITGIASLYNNIVLNGTNSKIITPNELINLGSDGGLGWSDYWKIIVEVGESLLANHLIKRGEEYLGYLYESISTWPEKRRITLPAIQTVSRAVGATLNVTEYSNVTAAIMASKMADILAVNLASHVEDRTFPVSWVLMSAVEGVGTLCQNILAELQTVLTPNLPEDPSVDEMRQFLEYIHVFKAGDSIDALSLQEQTFLAQKQLQKYYLDKYIKSRASKESLPYLTNALRNLTYVLSKLTNIGQPAYSIENDFFFLSAEVVPASNLIGTTLSRPRVGVDVNSLWSYIPGLCEAATIPIQATVFKENPYFWGKFADRITSYVPVFEFGTAILGGEPLVYKLENKVVPECIDEMPTYDVGDTNKMIYILFNRQFVDDDILIFIRPNTTELIYEVYLNSNEKPNIEENLFEYTTTMQRYANYTLEDGHKLLIKASSYRGVGKVWLGLKPILENTDDQSLLYRHFCANVTSVSCLSWIEDTDGEYYWDKNMCQVSTASTKNETVCECVNTNKTLTVGTTFLVPPNKVDFKRKIEDTSPVGRVPVVGLVVIVFVSYLILLFFAWREDAKDHYKWAYSLLIDNDIADMYFYIIRVFTGMRSGSGTKSNIAFILAGDNSDTGIRMLDDQSHIGFETGSVRTFVMSTRRRLSHLMSMRIWHDDTGGNDTSWFLNKITVQDLQSSVKYSFVCEQWLDFNRGDHKVDRVLPAEKSRDVWSFKDMTSYTIAEHHLWISVFLRPFRSDFTRIQRLSCLFGLMFLIMVLTSMFMKSSTREEVQTTTSVGSLRFSFENFEAGIAAVTVATVLIAIVSFLFRFARTKRQKNDINSPLRKFYRKVNDKIRLDNSVLKTTYTPPAEKAVYHNLNFLPRMLSNFGWICLIFIVVLTTIIIFLTSDGWKLQKSEEWMTTVICGYLISFFIIELLKIALIVLLYSILCQRAYEPTEPLIDKESLEEITRYNSASLTINPEFANDLKPAVSPDKETLISNKSDRLKDHQLLKMFTQLALYSGILYLVYTISYESRDMRSYYLKTNVEQMFQFKEEVTDLKSFQTWLNGHFIDSYFASTFYGSELDNAESSYRAFASDLVTLRVGPARLRQLRARPERCKGPLGLGNICYNGYRESLSSTTSYCIGWKPKECAVSEKSNFFTSPAWEYLSPDEVWGFVTVAEYTSYSGGGYFMKLDVNEEVSKEIFKELMENKWFDRATRVAILEFTMYNANTNLFVYSKFVAEFPEVGGVITFTDIHVFRLFADLGPSGEFNQLLKFTFLLLVIVACIRTVYGISAEGLIYFKSPWNLLDLLALIMSIVTISIYMYKIKIINRTTALFLEDKNAYVGFENLAFYDFLVNATHGILVYLLSIRVSRILGYSGKINEMAAIISNAASDLVAFLVIFGITYMAYVIQGTLLFGSENEKYKDLFNTYGTITESIVGKNRLEKILVEKPGYAEFYYFTFVLFVLFTLTTMAAAILNFSISAVKEEQKKLQPPTNIVEVILDRLAHAFGTLRGKSRTKQSEHESNKSKTDQTNKEVNVNDILLDFHEFIRNIDASDKKNMFVSKSTSKSPKERLQTEEKHVMFQE